MFRNKISLSLETVHYRISSCFPYKVLKKTRLEFTKKRQVIQYVCYRPSLKTKFLCCGYLLLFLMAANIIHPYSLK